MGESYATRQPSYFFFFSNNYCTSTKICKCHFVTFDKFCAHNLQNLLKYIFFLFRTCLNKIMVIKVQRLQLREVEGRKLSFAPLWFHRPCAFLPKGFFLTTRSKRVDTQIFFLSCPKSSIKKFAVRI